jgi:hypothetical protein
MIDGRSLTIVTERICRLLTILESVEVGALSVAVMEDGCPAGEVAPILGYLQGRGIILRVRGMVSLGAAGRTLLGHADHWRASQPPDTLTLR